MCDYCSLIRKVLFEIDEIKNKEKFRYYTDIIYQNEYKFYAHF